MVGVAETLASRVRDGSTNGEEESERSPGSRRRAKWRMGKNVHWKTEGHLELVARGTTPSVEIESADRIAQMFIGSLPAFRHLELLLCWLSVEGG